MTIGLDRNNPFDLEPNDIQWLGETAKTSPITFDTMADGLRAGIKVFYAYQREGFNTPTQAIYRFAPPGENPTQDYVANVCAWTGFQFDQALDFHDEATLVPWCQAILRQEQGVGHGITDGQIIEAKGLADALS